MMLGIYTFVFSVVFQARWQGGPGSKTEFALALFAGLIIFNLFAECINKAPTLIMSNSAYVKKVVFPLEVLPIVTLASAFFHVSISLLVWLLFYLLPSSAYRPLPLHCSQSPSSLCLFSFSAWSWLLAALGVYLRDISQVVGVITTAPPVLVPNILPGFRPTEEPPRRHPPEPLDHCRRASKGRHGWGKGVELGSWLLYLGISLACAWLGFAFFQRTRKGFADVI